jgi:hypothetical protein
MPPVAQSLTGRQRLVVVAATLATLLLAIEVTLGARGVKEEHRPFYRISFAVEWCYVYGSDKPGLLIGQLLYYTYVGVAWFVRLTGPTLRQALYTLIVEWCLLPLWLADSFVQHFFKGLNVADGDVRPLANVVYTFSVTAALVLYLIRSCVLAYQERARLALEREAAGPPPAPQPPRRQQQQQQQSRHARVVRH